MTEFKKDLYGLLKISPFLIIYGFVFNHFFGSVCLFDATIGYPCPGCGLTRALISLLKGNLKESLTYHMLLIPTLIYLLYALLTLYKFNKKNRYVFFLVTFLFFITFITYYIYRLNIYFPNQSPMTINEKAILQRLLNLKRH